MTAGEWDRGEREGTHGREDGGEEKEVVGEDGGKVEAVVSARRHLAESQRTRTARLFLSTSEFPRPSPSPAMPIQPDLAPRPLNVTDALSYLDAVKVQFQDKPDVYNHFLDIMKDFKSEV